MTKWIFEAKEGKGCWCYCDNCGALLNTQQDFIMVDSGCVCTVCGENNKTTTILLDEVIWNKIKEEIREQYDLTHIAYRTWIEPLVIQKIEDTNIVIAAPGECGVEYIKKKYSSALQEKIQKWTKKNYDLYFVDMK